MKKALLLQTLAASLAGYSRTTATIDWTAYAPTPAPKGLMITFAEGPDTCGFAWQTDTSVSESRVWLLKGRYGSADAAAFDASTTVFDGTATTVDKPTLVCHQVKVTGLEPGATYSYRYGGNGHYAYGTFAVSASDQPITILHVSDIQIKDFAKLYTWENTAERAAATSMRRRETIPTRTDTDAVPTRCSAHTGTRPRSTRTAFSWRAASTTGTWKST